MKKFKSIHFWIDLVLITGFVIVLGENGINFKEQFWPMMMLIILFVGMGINGYIGGVKDMTDTIFEELDK